MYNLVQGLGFRVQGVAFSVWGLGSKVEHARTWDTKVAGRVNLRRESSQPGLMSGEAARLTTQRATKGFLVDNQQEPVTISVGTSLCPYGIAYRRNRIAYRRVL